jgi:hypothetical protein
MDIPGHIGGAGRRVRPPSGPAAVVLAVLVLVAGAAGAGALAAGGAHPPAPSPAARTRQVVFDELAPGGHLRPSLHVVAVRRGSCVVPGVARRSSYRCFTDTQPKINAVYDPCFAAPKSPHTTAYCVVAGPLTTGVVQLDARALPAPTPAGPGIRPWPWAIELASGRVCVFVVAAWVDAGPYACLPKRGRGRDPQSQGDCRVPQRSTPSWRTRCQARQRRTSPFRLTNIVVVWY